MGKSHAADRKRVGIKTLDNGIAQSMRMKECKSKTAKIVIAYSHDRCGWDGAHIRTASVTGTSNAKLEGHVYIPNLHISP